MSNCSKISELLSAYLDGEISAKDKEIVETHLAECASCKQKLEIMQKTQNILKNAPPMPVPETLLKDFEEYRKKSEQTEKKVVPFYRNYRLYASIAAIFVFAFVLKSGLWQEDKFVPDTLSQMPETQQTTIAPATENKSDEVKNSPVVVNKKATGEAKKEKAVTPATPETPVTETTAENAEAQPIAAENTPVVADATSGGSAGGADGAAYDESQNAAVFARRMEDPETVESPTHLIVYVEKKDLENATKLFEGGKFFYSQVDQKLTDNFIPFESNILSLDESVPHTVEVLVKEN